MPNAPPGLSDLRVSGSAQFGGRGLNLVLERIFALANNPKMRVLFLDLRQEPHCHVDIDCQKAEFEETASHEVELTDEMNLATCWYIFLLLFVLFFFLIL